MTKKAITALAFSLCTAGLILTSCSDSDKKEATNQAPPLVKVFNIRKATVTDTATWMGYLRGEQETDIYPQVSGFITEYKEGKKVSKGEVIFKIDEAPFRAEYNRADAELKAAEAALKNAIAKRDEYQGYVNHYTSLKNKDSVPEKDIFEAEQNLIAAQANIKACEADIEQKKAAKEAAQINLEYTSVKAPYDGYIGTSNISSGELVSPATKLGHIVSDGDLRIDFSINSDALTKKKNGPAPDIEIILEDGSIYPHKGQWSAMNRHIDSTGLIDVTGRVANPDGLLSSGMKVNVRIPLPASEREAILVPPNAIFTVLRNSFIVVVDGQNIPHSIPVTIEGTYEIDVTEPGTGSPGTEYTSKQKFVAVSSYTAEPLETTLQKYVPEGKTIKELPVVADADNGVMAMNISSANSRIADRKKEQQKAYNKQQESVLSSILTAVGLEDEVASPDSIVPAIVQTTPLTFRPAAPLAAQKNAQSTPANSQPTQPPVPVKVTPILQQDVRVYTEYFGTLRSKEETEIRPHVSGLLLEQNFSNGRIVKKDEPLYKIDPAPYEAELKQAEANLASALANKESVQAELKIKQDNLARLRKIDQVKKNDITAAESAVLTKEAELRYSDANIEKMKAAVESAKINLGYTVIKAPFEGRVGISTPSIGALVSASDPEPMVMITSIDTMLVDFQLSGKDALRYNEQTNPNDSNSVIYEIILEDGTLYEEKVTKLTKNSDIKRSTGTLNIVGEVKNNDNEILMSGMPVTVRKSEIRENVYLVPVRAPMNAEGHDIILVIDENNIPKGLPITRDKIVTVPVTGPDGKVVEQPMQIIKFDTRMLGMLGLNTDLSKIRVIVEGTIPAGMAMKASPANTVAPRDFIYTIPQTVEPSVTADKTPTSYLKKF